MRITFINCEKHLTISFDTLKDWMESRDYPQYKNIGRQHSGIAKLKLNNDEELVYEIWQTKQGWTIRNI